MISLINNILNRKHIKNARNIGGICRSSFGLREYENGEYVIVPTHQGKLMLLKMEVYTPSDPGDQHFYKYEKICYV